MIARAMGRLRRLLPALALFVVAMGPLAGGAAEASVRGSFWVAGSVPDLATAIREQERLARGTGMQVQIVHASVRGKPRYRLLVRAADSPANRELQRKNLEYFRVRDPWLVRMDLPLEELVPGGSAEPAPAGVPSNAPPAAPAMLASTADVPGEMTPALSVAPGSPEPATATAEPPPPPPGARVAMTRGSDDYDAGVRAFLNRDYQEAVDRLTRALAGGMNNSRLYYYRGRAYSKLRNPERAIQDLDQAIRLEPTFSDAYNRRGFCYERIGNQEQALRDYNKALELDAMNGSAIGNHGRIFLYQILPVLIILLI